MDTNKALIRSLGLDSPELELSRESFLQQWRTCGFRVKTFQESLGFSGVRVGHLNEKVVSDISSSLDDPRERAETLHADHRSMAKFWGRLDPNHLKVGGELKAIVSLLSDTNPSLGRNLEPELSEQEKACLETLSFPGMLHRQQNIREPLDDTCQWLQQSEVFKNWYSRINVSVDCGLLWIKGKPGSGKSTLIKHTVEFIERAESRRGANVAAFYFNARGDELQKAPLGLLRSLLCQLCFQDSSIRASFLDLYREQHRKGAIRDGWSQHDLQAFIRRMFRHGKPRRTFLLVDALDECDEQTVRSVVYFFAEVAKAASESGRQLNICLSSRHYPTISIPNCPDIKVEEGNESDIATYIHNRLRFVPSSEASIVAELVSSVTQKASGMFLWVEFILDHILHDMDAGQPMSKLAMRLKQVPRTMEELYAERCQSLSAEERVFSIPLIQWVLFSRNWLNRYPSVIVDAAYFSPPPGHPLTPLPEFLAAGECTSSLDRTVRRIKDASRGLIEVTTNHKVQFIHETAREFFLTGPGLGLLDPRLAEKPKGLSLEALVKGCLNVLHSNVGGDLYDHCQNYILDYAKDTERHGGSNIALFDSIQSGKHPGPGPEPGESILRFAARENLTSIVLALLAQGVHADDAGKDDTFSTPLVAAFGDFGVPHTPDPALIAALVTHGANLESQDAFSKTPLLLALSFGWLNLAEFLVASGADVNFACKKGCVLEFLVKRFCVFYGVIEERDRHKEAQYLRLLDTLLTRGGDPNVKHPINGIQPLHYAARNGNMEVVQRLLSHGASANADSRVGTPLFIATGCLSPAAVQICTLLLGHGADVNRGGNVDGTPLHNAASYSTAAGTIRLLLGAGADVDALDWSGANALHRVANRVRRIGGDEPYLLEMAEVLIEAGCSRTKRNHMGETPLDMVLRETSDIAMKMRKLLAVDDDQGD